MPTPHPAPHPALHRAPRRILRRPTAAASLAAVLATAQPLIPSAAILPAAALAAVAHADAPRPASGGVPLKWIWSEQPEAYIIDEHMEQRVEPAAPASPPTRQRQPGRATPPAEDTGETLMLWKRRIEYTERRLPADEAAAMLERHGRAPADEPARRREPSPDIAVVERRFDAVAVELDIAGDRTVYDSRAGTPPDARSAPFAAMVGKTVRFAVNDAGEVLWAEGADEVVQQMFDPFAGTELGPLIRADMGGVNDRRLADQIEGGLRLIPGRIVRPGETWPVAINHAVPLVGDLRSTMQATLSRPARSRAGGTSTITVSGRLEQAAAEGSAGRPALSLASLLKMESSSIEGDLRFDHEQGRIDRQEVRLESTWSTPGLDALTSDPASGERTVQRLSQRATLRRAALRE